MLDTCQWISPTLNVIEHECKGPSQPLHGSHETVPKNSFLQFQFRSLVFFAEKRTCFHFWSIGNFFLHFIFPPKLLQLFFVSRVLAIKMAAAALVQKIFDRKILRRENSEAQVNRCMKKVVVLT
jgi:hypothetical protein